MRHFLCNMKRTSLGFSATTKLITFIFIFNFAYSETCHLVTNLKYGEANCPIIVLAMRVIKTRLTCTLNRVDTKIT